MPMVVKFPKEVYESVKFNSDNRKCSLCMRIAPHMKNGEIDLLKLKPNELEHLFTVVRGHYDINRRTP